MERIEALLAEIKKQIECMSFYNENQDLRQDLLTKTVLIEKTKRLIDNIADNCFVLLNGLRHKTINDQEIGDLTKRITDKINALCQLHELDEFDLDK